MPSAVAHIAAELFGNPRELRPLAQRGGIEVIAATGALGEIQQVARRIKRLLVVGDGAGPVSPDDVLVVFRSLTAISPIVREVFDSHGIAYEIESPRRLIDSPAIAALLAVIALRGGRLAVPTIAGFAWQQLLPARLEAVARRGHADRSGTHPAPIANCRAAGRNCCGNWKESVVNRAMQDLLPANRSKANHPSTNNEEAVAELDGQERRAARQRRLQRSQATLELLKRLEKTFTRGYRRKPRRPIGYRFLEA